MSDVVKKADLDGKHGITVCTLSQVAESREMPNRKRGATEWNDSDDCGALENKLREVSTHMVDDRHEKYVASIDSQEGERVEAGLIRVDLSSELSSTEDHTPTTNDCEAHQQRLLPLPSAAPEDSHLQQQAVKRIISDCCLLWLHTRPLSRTRCESLGMGAFEFLIQVKHGVPQEPGCSFLAFVPPCCVKSSEG